LPHAVRDAGVSKADRGDELAHAFDTHALQFMSVAVLSLREIIASIAVCA